MIRKTTAYGILLFTFFISLSSFASHNSSGNYTLPKDFNKDTLLIVIDGVTESELLDLELTVVLSYKKNAKLIHLGEFLSRKECYESFNYLLLIHLFEPDQGKVENLAIYTYVDNIKDFKAIWSFQSVGKIPKFKPFLEKLSVSESRNKKELDWNQLDGMFRSYRFVRTEQANEIFINRNNNFSTSLLESLDATILVSTLYGQGSGFFIDSNHIVTNQHVVENSVVAMGTSSDGKHFSLLVVKSNKDSDLAILRSNYQSDHSLDLFQLTDSSVIGSEAFAIGTPYSSELINTLSGGIVSGKRSIENFEILQVDAPINPGNSGGPLVNSKGELLGVVVAKIAGLSEEGIGFAIPKDKVVESLKIVSE